jgi:hypothetical protein
MADPRVSLWLALLPSWRGLFVFSRVPSLLMVLLVFVPLLFPLLAAWGAWRPATRLLSLVGLRISLPLIGLALFFWSVLALELYAPSSGLQGLLSRVLFIPPVAFALSFCCCFLAAISVRRVLEAEATPSLDALPVAAQESADELTGPEKTPRAAYPRQLPAPVPLLLLTIGGLLCQALAVVGLSLPYTTTYDPYMHATWSTTGWQTFGLDAPSFPVMFVLLTIPLLPVLAVLIGRWPALRLSLWRERLLAGGILLSYWLNLAGLLVSGIMLAYALLFLGTDSNKQTHWLGAASGLPVLAFLLALTWSGLLRTPPSRGSQARLT